MDLHIHSRASEYKEGNIIRDDKTKYLIVEDSTVDNIDTLLEKLNLYNINLFSITDHNRFDSNLYKAINEKLCNYTNVKCLLAGIEFDVQLEENMPSCHIITIFDTKSNQDLEHIHDCIEKDKLLNKNDFYELERFEKMMKNIGLNTIFIASQRKSLDNKTGGKNSISNSVNDIYEFLKIAFISALEYQKSSVKGMLLDNLKDFQKEIGMVCGSDCHQWSVYPKHDETEKNEKKSHFTIKALPSFLGLLLALTSPNTRFKRRNNSYEYIKEFFVGDKSIPLSSGINVIIGENGSGKSTLFDAISGQKLQSYQNRLIKNSGIIVEKKVGKLHRVYQNEIIEKSKNSSSNLFDEKMFAPVDNSVFEKNIKDYSKDLLSYIKNNISNMDKKNKIMNSRIELNPELYFAKTYYITINNSDFSVVNNIYKSKLESLNKILIALKTEIKDELYEKEHKNYLIQAFNKILVVRNEILEKFKKIYLENEIRNLIIEKSNDYSDEINRLSVEEDQNVAEYKKKINIFTRNMHEYYNSFVFCKKEIPIFDETGIIGFSENKSKGYIFLKKMRYYQNDFIISGLLEKIFNKNFQTVENIAKINTTEQLISSIYQANRENYESKYEGIVDKYIKDQEECTYEVLEATSLNKMGNTLGEKSLVYYKYLTSEDSNYEILFIDQPEDNISNIRIASDLISYLGKLRDQKQIIFVTHNPLLVINLDVDNVIVLNNINNKIEVDSGCLEYGEILEKVSKLLDGGRETLEKRLKLYYGK